MELLSHAVEDLDAASTGLEDSALRLTSPSSSTSTKVQQSWTKCNRDLIQIKNALKEIDTEIKNAPTNNTTITKATSIMKNQYSLLLHKYLELMHKFQSTQQKNREAFKQNIARQIRIVKPDAQDEEVEQVIKDGITNVFTAQIALVSSQKNKAKDLMIDIQEQHNQVLKIEKSIYDLQQLFVDVKSLVQAQDLIINNIEANVNSTEMYTEKGIRQMRNAVKRQKKWRKFVLWTMFILIVIGGIVCAIVFGQRLMMR